MPPISIRGGRLMVYTFSYAQRHQYADAYNKMEGSKNPLSLSCSV